MSRQAIITPQARIDVLELADYIARDSLDAALRFLEAAEAEFVRLADMPGMGHARKFSSPLLSDVRSWAIPGFKNHLIFYRPIQSGIEVLRVLHGARDIEAQFE